MKLLLLIIPFLLVGCSSTPTPTTIVKTEYITYTLPNTLLEPCSVSVPISIDEYMSLSPEGRETALTDYVVKLLGDLHNCNESKTSIRTFIDNKLETIPKNTTNTDP